MFDNRSKYGQNAGPQWFKIQLRMVDMPHAHTTIKLLSALAATHAFARVCNCAAMAGMGFGLLLSTVVLAQGEPLDAETKPVEERVPKVVRFNQHVRPILSDNCFFCHGPDKANRKGDLRLDIRADAVAAKAIVPGVPADSEMITRIYLPQDEEDLMPPSESHKELSAIEKATLKKWVASGATYETHWAYAAIVRASTQCPVFGTVYKEYTRRDSNPQPSVPKTDALSSCATGA